MMAVSSTRLLRAVVLAAFAFAPGLASAEMLDEPACNQLKTELQRLGADGVMTEMLHGADWAKTNLPAARLEQIKHLMDVEEQIAFRCPVPPSAKVVEPAAAAADDDAVPKTAKKKRSKKQQDDSASADTAPTKPATPAAADAKPDSADKPAVKVQKKKKSNGEPKPVSDAFVAPQQKGNAFVDGEAEPVPQGPSNGASSKQLSP